ncbi:hypothetical protein ACJMK2_044475 [Sinanodonta woodiana]|uniref:Uncharacterized protein n=1 Tax=Sinanodonta woodiana TaxID=1069815 RepID=A0ABD3W065_SINWO
MAQLTDGPLNFFHISPPLFSIFREMQSQENNDQVPHLVIQSDEEIYQKFQELKEKMVNLKESNRIIESRLDVLCRGVDDREQTQCPECKRQNKDEAELLKALQEKARALEEQERQHEEEMKKLGESLKTVMTNFDKLLEIANKSKQGQEDLATVHSETRGMGSFEHKGNTSQDITQADCAQPVEMDVDNKRGTDSVIASVPEIRDIQTPGPQQTLNEGAKDSRSDKNKTLEADITGDNFQEALQPVKDTKAGVAVEDSGSIKNPNFQRKAQNFSSKEIDQDETDYYDLTKGFKFIDSNQLSGETDYYDLTKGFKFIDSNQLSQVDQDETDYYDLTVGFKFIDSNQLSQVDQDETDYYDLTKGFRFIDSNQLSQVDQDEIDYYDLTVGFKFIDSNQLSQLTKMRQIIMI